MATTRGTLPLGFSAGKLGPGIGNPLGGVPRGMLPALSAYNRPPQIGPMPAAIDSGLVKVRPHAQHTTCSCPKALA